MRMTIMSTSLRAFVAGAIFSAPIFAGAAQAGPDTPGAASGQHVYMAARCFACHGQMGYGGVGPRFRQNRFVGMGDYVVGQILVGRGVMPSFEKTLNDQEIAAVATYIRNSWGNSFGPVKATEVAQVRQNVKLKPLQGRTHLPPESEQPKHAPAPPQGSGSPGQALPPDQSK